MFDRRSRLVCGPCITVTVPFAAPELFSFGHIDGRADVFGPATTMMYMLCGEGSDDSYRQIRFYDYGTRLTRMQTSIPRDNPSLEFANSAI